MLTCRLAGQAIRDAQAAARAAVVALAQPGEPNPPSTTYLSAVITPAPPGAAHLAEIVISSIGDSRAYWLAAPGSPDTSGPLTGDDTLAAEQDAGGSLGDTLTRWLGPDAPRVLPTVTTFHPRAPGMLLLLTDGLWRRLPTSDSLRAAAGPDALTDPLAAVDGLAAAAVGTSGVDDLSAVAVPVTGSSGGPAATTGAPTGSGRMAGSGTGAGARRGRGARGAAGAPAASVPAPAPGGSAPKPGRSRPTAPRGGALAVGGVAEGSETRS